MDLSVALAASNTWRTWGCGTASSALCSMARNGTVRDFAQVTPSALLSSGDHWDNQARSVEKRAMPTGPLFTVSGMPMKHRPIGRSLGSMVGSRKRGSGSDKGALYIMVRRSSESFEALHNPCTTSTQPCSLARTERGEEIGAVWRTACRRIQVQRRVNAIRIVLIQHRRVDPFREHPGPSRMCCLENEGIGGHQTGLLDTAGVSSGRGGYCWIFSLRLVQQ